MKVLNSRRREFSKQVCMYVCRCVILRSPWVEWTQGRKAETVHPTAPSNASSRDDGTSPKSVSRSSRCSHHVRDQTITPLRFVVGSARGWVGGDGVLGKSCHHRSCCSSRTRGIDGGSDSDLGKRKEILVGCLLLVCGRPWPPERG